MVGHQVNGLWGKIGKFLLNQLKDGNQFAAIVSDFSKICFDLFQKRFFFYTELYINSRLQNCKLHLFHGAIGRLNAFPQQEA